MANTVLNAYRDSSHVPDCSTGIADALASGFRPARWQLAIDAVDTVLSGTYQISPEACVPANMIVPLHAAESKGLITSPVLAKAHCVTRELASSR